MNRITQKGDLDPEEWQKFLFQRASVERCTASGCANLVVTVSEFEVPICLPCSLSSGQPGFGI
mgnify:CR=1 FL=1